MPAGPHPDTIGPFHIEGLLGRGAMSVVYRGHDPGAGRRAAVKLLQADILAEAERDSTVTRFLREAALCQALDHPNVVKVFDSGAVQGNPYLAMELLEGRSLAELLRGPRLAPGQAARLVLALLDALGHVHSHRIVHRDIKPANMILREDGRLTVIDFGIAHQAGSDVTQLGDMLGSPAYMSPEQLAGHAVDHRADLFAAGVVLYALLTRQRPFSGTVASVMQAILQDDPPPVSQHVPDLPAALDRVVMQALAKDPDARFQTARAFATALEAVLPLLDADTAPAVRPAAARPDGAMTTNPERLAGLLAEALDRAEAGTCAEADLRPLEGAEADWPAIAARARPGLMEALDGLPARMGALIDTIVTTAPLPETRRPVRGDWMNLVRLAAVCMRLAHRLGETALARAHHRRVADELSEPFIVHVDTVARLLASGDTPDLDRLSMGLLRLDVLEMALESLSAAPELRLARKTRLLVAIQAMRRVNDLVSGYTRTRDMMARFDVALVMSEVEALIAIASRLTDEAGVPPGRQLAETAQEAIRDFIAGAGEMVALSIEDLAATDLPAGLRGFAAKLRQLRALYHFAVHLPGHQHRVPLGRLAGAMRDGIEELARDVMARPQTGAGRTEALSELYELADDLGWQALAAEILSVLNESARAGGRE